MSNNLVDKVTPIEPYIEVDGGYACCPNCHKEVYPDYIITVCPKCEQFIRWDWLEKFK